MDTVGSNWTLLNSIRSALPMQQRMVNLTKSQTRKMPTNTPPRMMPIRRPSVSPDD